jgi:NADH dehydrogenase
LSTLGVTTDRVGRIGVGPFLEIPDKPGMFVVGDAAAATQGGRPLPGVVGRLISAALDGCPQPRPFRYFDRGNMGGGGKEFCNQWSRVEFVSVAS